MDRLRRGREGRLARRARVLARLDHDEVPQYGPKVIWHNGGAARYRSFIGFVKATKTAVVVLGNSDASVDSIGLDVLGLLNAKMDRPR
jgi:hypothetical protein